MDENVVTPKPLEFRIGKNSDYNFVQQKFTRNCSQFLSWWSPGDIIATGSRQLAPLVQLWSLVLCFPYFAAVGNLPGVFVEVRPRSAERGYQARYADPTPWIIKCYGNCSFGRLHLDAYRPLEGASGTLEHGREMKQA